jgi:hypothetical protein
MMTASRVVILVHKLDKLFLALTPQYLKCKTEAVANWPPLPSGRGV